MGFCCSLPRTFFSSSRVFPSWAFCSERELGARAVCWFPFGRSLSKDSAIKEVPAWGFYRTYWCTATHKSPPGSPSKREKWKPAAKCRHACQVLYLAFGSQNMRFSVLTRSRYTFFYSEYFFQAFKFLTRHDLSLLIRSVAPFLGYRIYRSITLKCTWYANLPKNRRPLLPKSWHIVFIPWIANKFYLQCQITL